MADATMAVTVEQAATLAVEHWRLMGVLRPVLDSAGAAPVRHALRKMGDVLVDWEVEARSLDGMPYDVGLAVRVVDRVERKGAVARIIETVSPLVTFKGEVVRVGEVVVEGG